MKSMPSCRVMSWMVTMPGCLSEDAVFRFLHEAAAVEVGCPLCRKNLDCDEPVQVGVVGLVDDAHAALAELLQNPEMAERLANHRRGLRRVRIGGPQPDGKAFSYRRPWSGTSSLPLQRPLEGAREQILEHRVVPGSLP